MPLVLRPEVVKAEEMNGGVAVTVRGADGREQVIEAYHILAATGYKVDTQRVHFLDPSIRSSIQTIDKAFGSWA